MKKFALLIIVLSFLFVTQAAADWSVTISGWTESDDPKLNHESVLIDGVLAPECEKILKGAAKTCTTTVTSLTNQTVWVKAYDIEGNSSQPLVGQLGTGIAPPTGPFVIQSVYIQ